jgi:hypothetical protein
VNSIEGKMSSSSISDNLRELYTFTLTTEKTAPPSADAIGNWLEQNTDDKGYFAKPKTGVETYQKQVPKTFLQLLGDSSGEPNKLVHAQRTVMAGFSFTFEMPFEHIRLHLEPRTPNLAPEECYIVPIVSRTHLRLFWAFAHFAYVDWDRTERAGKLDWATAEAPLKDAVVVDGHVASIFAQFSRFVEEPLLARWGPLAAAGTALPGEPQG